MMGNGGKGVTARQEGVAGSETTEELVCDRENRADKRMCDWSCDRSNKTKRHGHQQRGERCKQGDVS